MTLTAQIEHQAPPVQRAVSRPLHLLVGRNSRRQWVVREQRARCGGLFDSRAEALRFAFGERGDAAGAVVLVPDVIELFDAPADCSPEEASPPDPSSWRFDP